jgi:mannan endo-1,4-beta-mannosidase
MPTTLTPIDSQATQATKNLYAKLHTLRNTKTIFGHHDTLAYGVGWTADNPNSRLSDVSDSLSNKDMPGIFGWDIGEIETGSNKLINYIDKTKLKQWIQQVHRMGCINTICWHASNPVTGLKNDKGDGLTVSKILDGVLKPTGSNSTFKDIFRNWLSTIANFMKTLKADDGTLIPIIFRPFHECNVNNCFWWDKTKCTPTDFIKLWRLTVTHLKDVCGVHNILYAFALNDGFTNAEFTSFYPDNGFVDIIGLDAYQRPGTTSSQYIAKMQSQTNTIIQLADARNKLPAITEMGCNNLANGDITRPYTNWFTETLTPAIKDKRIAYCMLWRNPKGAILGDNTEFYSCYPTHATMPDFNVFYQHPEFIFAKSTGRRKVFG